MLTKKIKIMQIIKKFVNYTFILLSYLAIGITYPALFTEGDLVSRINARFSVTANESLLAFFVVILLLVFHFKYKHNVLKINYWPYWIFGGATSIIYVFTMSVYQVSSNNLNYVANLTGKANLLVTFVALLGFMFIFTNLAVFLGGVIQNVNLKAWQSNYWSILILLSLVWIVQIFPLFPGMVSWDGYRQFLEYFHTHISELDFTYYPTSHHPWAATLIFGFLFSVGRKIGGANVGLFLIVLIQIVTSSIIYAKVIHFISINWGKAATIISFLFYSSPLVAFWQVTIEKTPLFLAFVTWFMLCYARILLNSYQKLVSIYLYIQLIASGILMSMFRNDGAYVVVISLIALIIVQFIQKKGFPKMLVLGFSVFMAVYVGWNKVALPLMNVVPGSAAEVLTLPMRQLSAVVINHPESLSKDDLATVNKITPLKKIPTNFNINHADDLKSLYPVDTFLRSSYEIKQVESGKLKREATPAIKKATKQYLFIWFKQFWKHPKTYFVSFFAADSQFLNPLLDNNPSSRGIMYGNDYMKKNLFLQPSWYHEIHYWFSEKTRKYITWPNILFTLPIIRTIFQPAFALWTILFSLAYCLYKKSYFMIMCIPIGLLAVVPLLSPVNGMERYMLPAIYVLPLLLVVIVNVSRKGVGGNEEGM